MYEIILQCLTKNLEGFVKNAGFDKVVFLVDRRELDSRTSENFKAYAAYEPVSVDDTKHTFQLKKKLKIPNPGIIVTTTFKLNVLIKELEEAKDNSLADKKIVFIIDEAHRTTHCHKRYSIDLRDTYIAINDIALS